jgi:hypothetical protein
VDYSVTWIDDQGVHQSASGTAIWPDIFSNAALPAGWAKDNQETGAIAAGRIILGIDSGS